MIESESPRSSSTVGSGRISSESRQNTASAEADVGAGHVAPQLGAHCLQGVGFSHYKLSNSAERKYTAKLAFRT